MDFQKRFHRGVLNVLSLSLSLFHTGVACRACPFRVCVSRLSMHFGARIFSQLSKLDQRQRREPTPRARPPAPPRARARGSRRGVGCWCAGWPGRWSVLVAASPALCTLPWPALALKKHCVLKAEDRLRLALRRWQRMGEGARHRASGSGWMRSKPALLACRMILTAARMGCQ